MSWRKADECSPEEVLTDIIDRFEIDDAGCWLWTGYRNWAGYGMYRERRAHRLMYQAAGLEIPEGLVLDHLCRVRTCVNPDHLEPVTKGENSRRGITFKDTCRRGHSRTEENLYYAPSGLRQCRPCRRIREGRI